MLILSNNVSIPESEIEFNAVRAQGAGGQNVNKVSSAIHLRFDIRASSLPEFYKSRLLAKNDQRISQDGIIVIKAQSHRTQEKNKSEALERLKAIILQATKIEKVRRETKPSKSSKRKRVDTKVNRGKVKALRSKISW